MAKKKKGHISVLEAVDTLSHLAEIDKKKPQEEQIDPAQVQETFRTINTYLQHMYQKDRGELARPAMQKGIRAMIQLAGEAVDKVGQYTELFQGAHLKDESISEFKKLQQFYMSKVFSNVRKEPQEESWEHEGSHGGDERQVLNDLDTVRQDSDYDLFYFTLDDGTPFYTSNLLRHLRMVGNFDETFIPQEREDLMSQIDVALDRDLHNAAQKVLGECSDLIDLFYKEALQHKDNMAIMHLAKAIMALLLAANPKNLKHNSQGKCAINYWSDFVLYLRLGMETESYGTWLHASKLSEMNQVSLRLMHRMCHVVFLQTSARHDIEMLHGVVGKELEKNVSIWTSIAEGEKRLVQELQNYPSGPLMKTLKMFRSGQEKFGFDPLLQHNTPGQYFTLSTEELHTTILHMPAPIHQATVDKGEITAEFKGYLRALGERRHLYVNLQDMTSWKEELRCKLLEDLSQKGEFSEKLCLITLSKDSDFYHQVGSFKESSSAQEFCVTFASQVLGGKETGFYFPTGKTPKSWIEPLIKFVHQEFFQGKEELGRKERLDFIEIAYLFIILRYLDAEKPDVMNFSCKDGIDTGAALAGSFFGFTRMLSSKSAWTQNDRDSLIFAFFGPAFFIRHRSIDQRRLQRSLSALEHFEGVITSSRDAVLKGCAKILPEISFKEIRISA